MSFLSVLKKIGKVGEAVAPVAVTAINPAAGAITGMVVNAVVKAEESGGSGSEKKQKVMSEVLPMVGPLVTAVLQSAGAAKVDMNSGGVQTAVSQITDGVVALLNAIQTPQSAAAGPGASKPSGS